ncbi:hypothetical protein GCM10027277_07820 [Pseudoduganella ginsengisoli]
MGATPEGWELVAGATMPVPETASGGLRLQGVAGGSDGAVYFTDGNAVRKVGGDGRIVDVAGDREQCGYRDGPGPQARFCGPSGLAVGGDGNLYVADTLNHVIRRIAADGMVSLVAGRPGEGGDSGGAAARARFAYPAGLAAGGNGVLYVADSGNLKVRRIAPDGFVAALPLQPGPEGGAAELVPQGLAVAGDGTLLVTDGSAVLRLPQGGAAAWLEVAQRNAPAGARCDPERCLPRRVLVDSRGGDQPGQRPYAVNVAAAPGGLLVASPSQETLFKVAPDGRAMALAGPAQELEQGFAGVAYDGQGTVYAAAWDGSALFRWGGSGSKGTLSAFAPGRDGPAQQARFTGIANMALDDGGVLYVRDGDRLRRVSGGSVTTLTADGRFTVRDAGAGDTAQFFPGPDLAPAERGGIYAGVDAGVYQIAPGGSIRRVGSRQDAVVQRWWQRLAPGRAAFALQHPVQGLHADRAGNLYSCFGGMLTVVPPSGQAREIRLSAGPGAGGAISEPCGIVAAAPDGALYIAHAFSIARVGPDGALQTVAGQPGKPGYRDGAVRDAAFSAIRAMQFDRDGNAYIADGPLVRRMARSGAVSTVAGRAGGPPGTAATLPRAFGEVMALAVAPNGDLYVASRQAVVRIRGGKPAGAI